MRIASGQFSAVDDYWANLATIEGLMEDAARERADLMVLPEMSLSAPPASPRELSRTAQPLDGPFLTGVAAACRRLALPVVVGTIESNPSGLPYNTVVALGSDGRIGGTYRKIHLYDAFGYCESDGIAPGDLTPPFILSMGSFRAGVFTCYDLRFPESARRLIDAGANIILVPALWVPGPGKEEQWSTLLRARAIENTAYVVSANQTGPGGVGGSVIVDPEGVMLAAAQGAPEVLTADLDEHHLERIRLKNPSLTNRRFSVVPQSNVLAPTPHAANLMG